MVDLAVHCVGIRYAVTQACQQYIAIAIYCNNAMNIFIIALFSILQHIIIAEKNAIILRYIAKIRKHVIRDNSITGWHPNELQPNAISDHGHFNCNFKLS